MSLDVFHQHDDLFDALGGELVGQFRHGQHPGRGLAAGHGDVPVIEQFEGDVDIGRDAGLHGQRP